MHTADIAKSTQCWCEWILSSRFSPLRSAHAPLTCSGPKCRLRGRSLGLCTITADPVCEGHTAVHIIIISISAFSEYIGHAPLHVYILTIKQVQLANMEYEYTFG